MRTTRWLFGGRWTKIAGGVCAVLILTAVPAAALTWLTPWTTNFGQQGTVTVTATNDTVNAVGPSTLNINWGQSGGGKASGKFKASRSYTLGAGETRLSIAQTINQSIRDAGANASVKVKVKRGKITLSGGIKGIYDQAASPSSITVSGA
jgi:hypothetical protein